MMGLQPSKKRRRILIYKVYTTICLYFHTNTHTGAVLPEVRRNEHGIPIGKKNLKKNKSEIKKQVRCCQKYETTDTEFL